MIKEKEFQAALAHFSDGGNLWYYSHALKVWRIQKKVWDIDNDNTDFIYNIIEDKLFEERKTFALSKADSQRKEKFKTDEKSAETIYHIDEAIYAYEVSGELPHL